jgi:hypothetical protein
MFHLSRGRPPTNYLVHPWPLPVDLARSSAQIPPCALGCMPAPLCIDAGLLFAFVPDMWQGLETVVTRDDRYVFLTNNSRY